MLTSRGVKYTHNDIKHSILDPDRGPTGLCVIPQEHPQKKVVGDGGAKHRTVDTPTTWHSVATRHAVVTIHQGGRTGPPDPNHIIKSVRPNYCDQSIVIW